MSFVLEYHCCNCVNYITGSNNHNDDCEIHGEEINMEEGAAYRFCCDDFEIRNIERWDNKLEEDENEN